MFNAFEVLYVAKVKARAMADAGYRPPLPCRHIRVAGTGGIAALKMMLVNMHEGGFISAHDVEIASRIAHVLCGGEVPPGSLVDEECLLRLEREAVVALTKTEKTKRGESAIVRVPLGTIRVDRSVSVMRSLYHISTRCQPFDTDFPVFPRFFGAISLIIPVTYKHPQNSVIGPRESYRGA